MALKRYSDEDALKILLKVEVHLDGNKDFLSACRTAPTPTISAKNRITYPAPRSGRLAYFFGVGPTPAVSFPHTPSAKPSSEPDCGSLGPVLQDPWPDQWECRPHGCGWPLAP